MNNNKTRDMNIPTEAELRVKVSEMTKHEFIALRDELESNWSESYRPIMNLLSLTSIIKFNIVLSSLES
ncbi:MAG: hypothetical protein ACR2M6_00365 [Vampirovibrionia bacterium]